MLQEENNCRRFSCLITQGLLTRITPDISDKVVGVNVYKVFNKRRKKNPPKTDGLINRYGGRDLSKSRIIAGKSIWHWQLIACIVNLILSTYLLSIYHTIDRRRKKRRPYLFMIWTGVQTIWDCSVFSQHYENRQLKYCYATCVWDL